MAENLATEINMTNDQGPHPETVNIGRTDVAALVARLRELRTRALEERQRAHRPPRLPSRKTLASVIERLAAALFPYRLGLPDITDDGIDPYVGHLLDISLRELAGEISREMICHQQSDASQARLDADGVVARFAQTLPQVRLLLDTDIQAAFRGDPAARSIDEVLVCYPGITAMIHHRLAHELHVLGAPLCARIIAEIAHTQTGIDIHPGATIGSSCFIDHGTGVVIGETAIIGERVRLYHGVTLGAKRFPTDENGSLVKGGARHPIVEDDVVIYAGATILGRITIGRGSVIGGNAWLTHSVPANSNVAQSQARQQEPH